MVNTYELVDSADVYKDGDWQEIWYIWWQGVFSLPKPTQKYVPVYAGCNNVHSLCLCHWVIFWQLLAPFFSKHLKKILSLVYLFILWSVKQLPVHVLHTIIKWDSYLLLHPLCSGLSEPGTCWTVSPSYFWPHHTASEIIGMQYSINTTDVVLSQTICSSIAVSLI